MKYSLGFSPCPNDTFIFDALVNNKIDTGDFEFEVILEDIQTLNKWANEGRLDITKLSFPAFFENSSQYSMLNSGSALGKGVGPMLIAKKMVDLPDLPNCTIAIPGENTTANFLLSYAFPSAKNRIPMLFSKIEQALLDEEVNLGVIIHENRFTYMHKGLIKVCDLGEIWEQRENVPIPLACIAALNKIPPDIRQKISGLIKESLQFAYNNYPELSSFTRTNAQEMDEQVMRNHIELYVNDYSLDLGTNGKKAINKLFEIYQSQVSLKI